MQRSMSDQMVAKGLAGVVVDSTAISEVRAEGALSYRGIDIGELVPHSVTEVANLLVRGTLDADLDDDLRPHINLTQQESQWVLGLPSHLHPMQVVQGLTPLLAPTAELGFGEADAGVLVAAKLPAVVATHLRGEAVPLDPDKPYAQRFVEAISPGANEAQIEAFNCAQILQLEHSFNAGTFAARVVASTLAPIQNAIAAGFGALSGALHGGADQAALNMVDELESVAAAQTFVAKALAQGTKIPGMGHREYRARDPRAVFLAQWAARLVEAEPKDSPLRHSYAILNTIDETFGEHMRALDKPLYPNVEFFKGLVYRAIGLPNEYFTTGFCMARVFGYIAHFQESRQDNRIFRPAARYIGPSSNP